MGISLVVLTYGKWELTHQLLSDVRQFFPADEVVVMDNGSEDTKTEEGCLFWKTMLPITYVRSDTNMGFAGGANFGIKEACEDKIALISNDVRITNKWPYMAIKEMKPNELTGGVLHNYDTGWNKFGDRLFPYLEGWFLAAHYELWERLGYFDCRFLPHDYEDVDLSTTALSLGVELKFIGSGLKHTGGGTIGYSPEREKITKTNRERFMQKWL